MKGVRPRGTTANRMDGDCGKNKKKLFSRVMTVNKEA